MAAEFLTFGAEGILTRAASLAEQELSLLWGFKGELMETALQATEGRRRVVVVAGGRWRDFSGDGRRRDSDGSGQRWWLAGGSGGGVWLDMDMWHKTGRGIEELTGLNMLKGELSIYNLEHVRDGEEAKKAKLVEKTNIRQLNFAWSRITNHEEVIEGFQPHPSKLEALRFYNFMGNKWPSWIMSSSFPTLKRNLTEWPESGIVVFPCLETLHLWNCDKLRSDAPSNFPSLKELEMDSMGSGMPIANISNNLTTLTSLTIKSIRGLAYLPEGMLKNNKNLAHLKIQDCQELSRIAPDVVGSCVFLESVHISKCPILAYLPDGLLTTSLNKFAIVYS
ncbi:unnamed protein product [Prunus armeniaca]|uniref:R13L1/DRL21-like LRR repeat region domain-containing protein n=1 Tax=Prunus armeniaca TaxID=36596 RepID=A0A6J5TZJ6_PRUAR|nr:unnamed protein product [Prunus armeniaca]